MIFVNFVFYLLMKLLNRLQSQPLAIMKKNWILLAIAALLWVSCQTDTPNNDKTTDKKESVAEDKPAEAVKVVSELLGPTDFEAKCKAMEGAQLLDVRTPEEVAAGALEGANNLNIKDADFKEKLAKLDKDKPVFVYCQGGVRSAKAADICKEMGFKEIYDMEGGYGNYEASKK